MLSTTYTLLFHRLLACMILILGYGSLEAAQPFVPQHQDELDQNWRWQVFDELKDRGLRTIAEDSIGVVWFGVDDGVLAYDGLAWHDYHASDGLPDGPVNALCTGPDGRLYAASDAGVGVFDGETWTVIFPKEENFYWPIDDLEVDQRGGIWMASPWGAVYWSGARVQVYTSSDMGAVLKQLMPYLEIIPVPDKVVFAHPSNARQMARHVGLDNADVGISIVKGGWLGVLRGTHPVAVWHVTEGSAADSAGVVAGDFVVAVNGRQEVQQYLFGGDAGSVVQVTLFRTALQDTFTVSLVRKKMPSEIKDWHVYDVMVGPDGVVYFGMWDGQVVRFDPNSSQNSWQIWSESDGLPLQYGPRLLQDRNKRLWRVTNFGGGVYRFENDAWIRVQDLPFSPGSPLTSICEDYDGRLFVGGGEVAAFKNGTWKVLELDTKPLQHVLPHHRLRLLFTKDQVLWLAGLGQGAARINLASEVSLVYPNLRFQADHPTAGTWFVGQDSSVIQRIDERWLRFDQEDGLMDYPRSVIVSRAGEVWVSGSDRNVAATAVLKGDKWVVQTHPRLSKMVAWQGDYAQKNGPMWFGAYHYDDKKGQVGGILRYWQGEWQHFEPPEALEVVYAIGETLDGRVWAGTHELQYFDGQSWQVEHSLADVWVHSLLGARDGSLWVGTRLKGVFHYDGQAWRQYRRTEGLEGNFFESLIQTPDGSIWTSGSQGVYRFDGRSWTADVLPAELTGKLRLDSNDRIWTVADEWGTAVFELEKLKPTVEITSYVDEVSPPGNTLIAWQGRDQWHETAVGELQYSWRANEGAWSRYGHENEHTFLGLDAGAYRFQVKARDKAFNESEIATIVFYVLPPIWRQGWFVGLVLILVSAIVWQSVRVVRRNRLLELTSEQLRDNIEVLRTLVDTVPIPIFLQDKEKVFTDCNRAFADLFGRKPQDILGQSQQAIWPTDIAVLEDEKWQKIEHAQNVHTYELTFTPQNGEPRQFVVTKTPLYDSSKGFDGVVAALFDMTQRQQAEAMARELERNKVVIQTAGAAAHKINQPLTAIVFFADFMMQREDVSEEVREDLQHIQDAGRAIAAIVKDMQTVRAYRTEKYVGDTDIVRFDNEQDGKK